MFKSGDMVKIKNDTLCINCEQAAGISDTDVLRVLDASDSIVILRQNNSFATRARPAENYELVDSSVGTTKEREIYESETDASTNKNWGLF